MKKENGNQRERKRRLVSRKQWNPGKLKTARQRNSKANSTKNKKTNVMSSCAILNYGDARTNGGDKIMESSERIGAR